jgi:SAM-dependent methyltransferase
MHPKVFKQFEKIIKENFRGKTVLEVGAVPNSDSLLSSLHLNAAIKVGINCQDVGKFQDFEVLPANANDMSLFESESFDLVMSNATLEHDPYFWKSLAEIKRVCRKGGLVIIGVPGYAGRPDSIFKSRFFPEFIRVSTPTLHLHRSTGGGDYYRFSEECILNVFLEGLHQKAVNVVLDPPRIIGFAYK